MPLTRVPAILQHADIARRIPHQGRMCLLERVSAWDTQQIRCEANSHQARDNPLRAHGRLGAACGIEYAAQAMAVHGALLAEASAGDSVARQGSAMGYLVSVRGVTLHVDRLDELSDALSIHAERLSGDSNTVLYSFTLHAGPRLLLAGRAAVILDAHGLALPPPGTTTPPNS